ncbi:MAG: hypothetical protein U1D99_02090, partial [Candidatus Omnitrophota bacterium]|nr:hypothetical protein [Candidatus Omnitrophota bacterium]
KTGLEERKEHFFAHRHLKVAVPRHRIHPLLYENYYQVRKEDAAFEADIAKFIQRRRSGHGLFVVGIAAESSAGKTTLAEQLRAILSAQGLRVRTVELDGYLKPRAIRKSQGLSGLDGIDMAKVTGDFGALRERRPFIPFRYVPATGEVAPDAAIEPAELDVLIIEGNYTFVLKDVLDNLDLRIYLDEDFRTRFYTHYQRDMRERGYTFETSIWNAILSHHDTTPHVIQHAGKADVIIKRQDGQIWFRKDFQLSGSETSDPSRPVPGYAMPIRPAVNDEVERRLRTMNKTVDQLDAIRLDSNEAQLALAFLRNHGYERMAEKLQAMIEAGLVRAGPFQGFLATVYTAADGVEYILLSNFSNYSYYLTATQKAASLVHEIGAVSPFSQTNPHAVNEKREQEFLIGQVGDRDLAKALLRLKTRGKPIVADLSLEAFLPMLKGRAQLALAKGGLGFLTGETWGAYYQLKRFAAVAVMPLYEHYAKPEAGIYEK